MARNFLAGALAGAFMIKMRKEGEFASTNFCVDLLTFYKKTKTKLQKQNMISITNMKNDKKIKFVRLLNPPTIFKAS